MTSYNGWKNRATWNVALWIGNDEGLYGAAVDYVRTVRKAREDYRRGTWSRGDRFPAITWGGFVRFAGLAGSRTPDRFSFTGRDLDRPALAAMLSELVED